MDTCMQCIVICMRNKIVAICTHVLWIPCMQFSVLCTHKRIVIGTHVNIMDTCMQFIVIYTLIAILYTQYHGYLQTFILVVRKDIRLLEGVMNPLR